MAYFCYLDKSHAGVNIYDLLLTASLFNPSFSLLAISHKFYGTRLKNGRET
jgi:hypothetical protein